MKLKFQFSLTTLVLLTICVGLIFFIIKTQLELNALRKDLHWYENLEAIYGESVKENELLQGKLDRKWSEFESVFIARMMEKEKEDFYTNKTVSTNDEIKALLARFQVYHQSTITEGYYEIIEREFQSSRQRIIERGKKREALSK